MKILRKLGGSEVDERVALKDHFLEGVLGYSHTNGEIEFEKDRTDVCILDNDGNKVVVIETKRSTAMPDKDLETIQDEVFQKYVTAYTKYVIVTNFRRLLLYANDEHRTVLADLYPYHICQRGARASAVVKKLRLEEVRAIGEFQFLTKEELWDERKYGDPEEYRKAYEVRRAITTPQGLEDLLHALERCMQYLKTYTLARFDEYARLYQEYSTRIEELREDLEVAKRVGNNKAILALASALLRTREEAKPFEEFMEGFKEWIRATGRSVETDEERMTNKELFCEESTYLLLGRVLFTRICEDKGLLTAPQISNGGVLRFWESRTFPTFRWLWEDAVRDAETIYGPIYRKGIFDWYRNGNSRFDEILKRIFWHLNHFDFTHVGEDILGTLYQRHFPPEKQAKLGGFYTKKPIVRYILDEVGYTAERGIRGKTMIDPACGSGTFLAEAMERYARSLPENYRVDDAINEILDRIRGFDVDPFAHTIAQIELLFKLIEIFGSNLKRGGKFTLTHPLRVYRTDSLKVKSAALAKLELFESDRVRHYALEETDIEVLKETQHDYLVGNPPYVQREITPEEKAAYMETYHDTWYGEVNLYRLFIHRAVLPGNALLKEGGILGFIVPNTWIADKYAEKFRIFLLKNFRVNEIVLIPERAQPFEGVTQATTILILTRIPTIAELNFERPEDEDRLKYDVLVREIERIDDLASRNFREARIPLWKMVHGRDFDYALLVSTDPAAYAFKEKLWIESTRLENLVEEIHEGEVHLTQHGTEIRDVKEGNIPLLRGEMVEPFLARVPSRDQPRGWFAGEPTRWPQCRNGRVVWCEIANMALRRRIQADYVEADAEHPVLLGNTTCWLRLKEGVDVDFVLGLLNSSTLNTFFKLYSSNNHVKTREIRRLPVKDPNTKPELARRISEIAGRIRAAKRRLEQARSLRSDPLDMLVGTDSEHVFHSAFITKLPRDGLKGPLSVRRMGTEVHLSVDASYGCSDERVARYLELVLELKTDLREAAELRIPRTMEGIERAIEALEQAREDVRVLPMVIEEMLSELDSAVMDLYGLDPDERSLVEAYSAGRPVET